MKKFCRLAVHGVPVLVKVEDEVVLYWEYVDTVNNFVVSLDCENKPFIMKGKVEVVFIEPREEVVYVR